MVPEPPVLQEIQKEIVDMIPKVVGDCAGLEVRYGKCKAGDIPASLYWDKFDPLGVMSQDKKQWKTSKETMTVPVITIDFSNVHGHRSMVNEAKWAEIEDKLKFFVWKYQSEYLFDGAACHEPWRDLNPGMILFHCKPFDYALTPTRALVRVPPECTMEFQQAMEVDPSKMLRNKLFLRLDERYDSDVIRWRSEWVDWNKGIADRKAWHECAPS